MLRKSAVAAAASLIVLHLALLAVRYGTPFTSLWGDWIGSCSALLAAAVCWSAARRSGSFGKRVWRLVSLSLVLAFLDELAYIYYFDYRHVSSSTLWPTDILLFLWTVPAMMTLFLSPRDPSSGIRWLRVCDFAQVCTLVLALELSTLYIPSRWQDSGSAMAVRVFHVGLAFFGLLALSFLVRGLFTRYRTARAFFLRLAGFFLFFAIGSNAAIFTFGIGHYPQGAWPDLVWTITFCSLVVIAATWDGAEPGPLETIKPSPPGMQLLAQFSPLLIPAIVFPLVLGIAQEQFLWSVVLVTVAFAAASGRLFVVQNQLLVSSRELQKNLALLQGITEGTTDAVFVKDLQGRYLMVNSAGAGFLGRSVAEVIGKNDLELFSPESGREIMERDRKVVQSGETQTYEEAGTAHGVARIYLATKGPFRDQDGDIVGLLGISRDITEHKMLEQGLRQSQRMEAVGRLAGGVAHDFNNLLTVIMGYSQILGQGLTAGSKLHDATTQIGSAAERAAGIARQLLAFSRKQMLAPRIIDLNELMLSLDSMLRRLIAEDIEILTVPAPDLGRVRADPGQIEQVLMNLALNARDAMPNGGKLTLETSNVDLDDAYAREHPPVELGRYVMLAVSDTGLGMSPETQAHIFEPFFTTKELGKGTGLGLSTVYGIVKQSGGYIWFYSEPGQGTAFKVYLPRVDQPVEKLGLEKSPLPVQRGTETVLLVEDDSQLRELASSVLAQCGYKVSAAGGGDEALALCTAKPGDIKLLITDVVMRGMNGRQLAEKVLRISPQVKVLYISGYTTNAIVHHGVLDAGLWFLPKPFSLAALVAKVREVLDSHLDGPEGSRSE